MGHLHSRRYDGPQEQCNGGPDDELDDSDKEVAKVNRKQTTPKVRVSIGMPVYNGEKYLAGALDSLLAQNYSDFELIISDNNSTDGTWDICNDYARKDSRIRLVRNETNIGAVANFNKVFELCQSEYFMWAAVDDQWDPSYIEECVRGLDNNPSAVMCGSDICFIDEIGEELTGEGLSVLGYDYNKLHTLGMDLRGRVNELSRKLNWYSFYGLIRTSVLRRTNRFVGGYGGDVVLLLELVIQGETITLPSKLFRYRIIPKTAAQQLQDMHPDEALDEEAQRPYTTLGRRLLETMSSAKLAAPVVAELKNDLLDNLSHGNIRWRDVLLQENVPPHPLGPSMIKHYLRRVLEGESGRPPFGFNIIGYVSGNLGLGVTARQYLKALRDKGYPVAVWDIDPGLGRGGAHADALEGVELFAENGPYACNLIAVPPEGLGVLLAHYPHLLEDASKCHVALSMWELPVLKAEDVNTLKKLDVLVAGSQFVRHAFEFNVPRARVLYAEHPLYLPEGVRGDRRAFGLPESGVLFITAFEPYSDVQRKNPAGAIEAFEKGACGLEDAYLVIKVNNAKHDGVWHPDVERLIKRHEHNSHIIFVTDSLSYEDVLRLYDSCDVYMSLHRSEGLGLGPMEAMALGKPVITTGWSGNMSFMDHTSACVVGYRLRSANGSIPAYRHENLPAGAVWADAFVEEAAGWVRKLATHEELRAQIGQKAKAHFDAYQTAARSVHFAEELRVIWENRALILPVGAIPNESVEEPGIDIGQEAYESWCKRRALEVIDGELFAERMMVKWHLRPTIHLVMTLLPGTEGLLADTLDSLSRQFYTQWGLSIVAKSPPPEELASEQLPNIEWITVDAPQDAAQVINKTVGETSADWVALIPPGTQFAPEALISCADYINRFPDWRLIYTDSDTIDREGRRSDPKFRPDFNLDLLRSMAYLGDFCLVRRDAVDASGGFAYSTAVQNYDLALKILDSCGEDAIGHIAEVLYHWSPNYRNAFDTANAMESLRQHFIRAGVGATVESGALPDTFRVLYQHESQPLVSIIIPTRDKVEFLEPCIESVLEKTSYRNYEVIVVDNDSGDPDTVNYLIELVGREPERVRVLSYPHPFNYSAISNMAVRAARGDYVLFLNNDTQIVHDAWLDRLVAHGQRPEVGVVGARLVYPETGLLQHAGVILGIGKIADHIYNGHIDIKAPGYMGRAQVDQNFSAVTAACMLVRRTVFDDVGGMDEDAFAVLYNDVDLCLKVGARGYKIVWTPYATLVHHGSASLAGTAADLANAAEAIVRGEAEREAMLRKWLPQIAQDPAYNRHLSLVRTDSVVETQVVPNWDVNFHDRPRVLGLPIFGGSGDYRVIQPLRALSRSGIAQTEVVFPPGLDRSRILSVSEIARAAPDTLIFQNAVNDHDHEVMRVTRQFSDALRVLVLDDLLTKVPPKSSVYRRIVGAYRDIRRRLRKSLELSDRLIVSTEPLRELCAEMIDDIRVIPNYLSRAVWDEQAPVRRERSRPRVGWAGAQQHQGDLGLIHDVVQATAGEVDWVFFGMCPVELCRYVKELHPFEVGFQNYAAKLATLDLDLAIAPLEINAFNEAKSNLRLLEYGYFGWPVVCTDILPYQNAPVVRIENDAQRWIQTIRERVHDLEALRREGEVLQTWVRRHWMLEDHLDAWRDALISRETVAFRKVAGNG